MISKSLQLNAALTRTFQEVKHGVQKHEQLIKRMVSQLMIGVISQDTKVETSSILRTCMEFKDDGSF